MKSEGWLFLQRAGAYASYPTLEEAFPRFVARVETLMRDEVREHLATFAEQQPPTPPVPLAPEPGSGR